MAKKTAILECEQISFCYPRQTQNAITDISFRIQEGEVAVLCGQSGCGKTTLLRHLKKNLIPFGMGEGKILYRGKELEEWEDSKIAAQIGYVGQNAEEQIVMDFVWHELAFGLENLGLPVIEMQRRTAEIAAYFGIENWYQKPVSALSGGQKQLLNLASVMVMQPEILLLDEPVSQLDPIGSRRFLDNLRRLNEDLGITVILSEQRLEDVLPMADHVLILHEGRLIGDTAVRESAGILQKYGRENGKELPIAEAMPVAMKVYAACSKRMDAPSAPVSIKEGQDWLRQELHTMAKIENTVPMPEKACKKKNRKPRPQYALEAKKIRFRYDAGQEILEDFELLVERGSFFSIMGGNGSGKTTALKVLMGICKAQRGKIIHQGKIRYLAQNPKSLFTELTVEEEFQEVLCYETASENNSMEKINAMLEFMELEELREQNPMDLSGGQQQRLALGKVLLTEPDILLLDEPTKGLDAAFKKKLAELFLQLISQGKTLLMVSHDMEFCAKYATHCGLLFDGRIVGSGPVREFFAENFFYTTAAGKMSQGLLENCILCEDIIAILKKGEKSIG